MTIGRSRLILSESAISLGIRITREFPDFHASPPLQTEQPSPLNFGLDFFHDLLGEVIMGLANIAP